MKINMNNYEEWMVAFVDGELNAEELTIFNQFIEKNPVLKSELADFESTQLTADENIIFDKKETLYKSSALLIALKKTWPIAAALLLALAIYPFIKSEQPIQPTIIVKHEPTKTNTPTQVVKPSEAIIETNNADEQSTTAKAPSQAVAKQVIAKTIPIVNPKQPAVKNQQSAEVIIADKKQPEVVVQKNNITQEADRPTIVSKEQDAPIEKIIVPEKVLVLNNEPARRSFPIIKINEENNVALHQKLTDVVTQVEDKIELIKELKRAPISVCIGNKKLFTLNN